MAVTTYRLEVIGFAVYNVGILGYSNNGGEDMITREERFREYLECKVELIRWISDCDVSQRTAMMRVAELLDRGDLDVEDHDAIFEAYITTYNAIGGKDEEYTENDTRQVR